jgi:hypothetical protein
MNRIILNRSEVSFDDEIAEYFYYDSKRQILEVGFGGLFHNGQYLAAACSLRISAWKSGKSRAHESPKFQNLESNLGVVSLLLSLDVFGDQLVMLVNTVDDRYVEWHFEEACLDISLGHGEGLQGPDLPRQSPRD